MREILFRGKTLDGRWVYGYYVRTIEENDDYSLFEKDWIYDEKGWCRYDVIPETVGQYTGLDDKNGEKIFEGGIVACGDGKVSLDRRKRWTSLSSSGKRETTRTNLGGNKMREKVKETLLNALEKELAVEGEEIRPYFVETLVDCLSRLDEEKAPQVQAEEPGRTLDISSNQRTARR